MEVACEAELVAHSVDRRQLLKFCERLGNNLSGHQKLVCLQYNST